MSTTPAAVDSYKSEALTHAADVNELGVQWKLYQKALGSYLRSELIATLAKNESVHLSIRRKCFAEMARYPQGVGTSLDKKLTLSDIVENVNHYEALLSQTEAPLHHQPLNVETHYEVYLVLRNASPQQLQESVHLALRLYSLLDDTYRDYLSKKTSNPTSQVWWGPRLHKCN